MTDLIRRADVLALAKDVILKNGAKHRCIDATLVHEIPSAEPEQKTGKWIVDKKRFGNTDRHCNLCGAILEGDDWKWRNNYYCYHCGTRMNLKGD